MKCLILLVFINIFLTKNVEPSKFLEHPDEHPASLLHFNEKAHENRIMCQTKECKKIAGMIRQNMDKSYDPCDNFYEYACGNWRKHNPVPSETYRWSLYDIIVFNISQQVQEILKVGPKNDDIFAVKLAKKWYTVCMDTDAMEKQGLDPLVLTLSRMGGWPITMHPGEWDNQKYTWQNVDDEYARLIGENTFYNILVEKSSLNESENEVKINTPNIPSGSNTLWNVAYQDVSQFDNSFGFYSENSKSRISDENEALKRIRKTMHETNTEGDNHTNHTVHSRAIRSLRTNEWTFKNLITTRIITIFSEYLTFHNVRPTVTPKRKRHILDSADKEQARTTSQITKQELKEHLQRDQNRARGKRQKYVNYVSKVARAIAKARDAKISEEQIDKDVHDLIDFQENLSMLTYIFNVNKDSHFVKMTISAFQKWYDNGKPRTVNGKIDWEYKISALFAEANMSVDSDLELKIPSLIYFDTLTSLLDQTSSRTIVNYVHWKFISKILKATTNEMREIYDSWEENKEINRPTRCIEDTNLKPIIAYEYLRQHFSESITKAAMDTIEDIQKEVEYQIQKSDWMDENTKDLILPKLRNMKKFVEYPDWYRNTTIVQRYFQGLIIDKSYYENTLSYERYFKWKNLRALKKNNDDNNIWWIDPLTLRAFYILKQNSQTMASGMLYSPFFDNSRPEAINAAFIGSIMAHEIKHRFDQSGHYLDENGRFINWLFAMAEAYNKWVKQFGDQFDDYLIDKVLDDKIKNYGNCTADKNIADTMGLNAAFGAYRRRESLYGNSNLAIPGLEEFTNDQLFFLSYSNLMCEASNLELLEAAKMDNYHTTKRLRVIKSLFNSKDFAKAFGCPRGSAMNPGIKCSIWQ